MVQLIFVAGQRISLPGLHSINALKMKMMTGPYACALKICATSAPKISAPTNQLTTTQPWLMVEWSWSSLWWVFSCWKCNISNIAQTNFSIFLIFLINQWFVFKDNYEWFKIKLTKHMKIKRKSDVIIVFFLTSFENRYKCQFLSS